MRKDISLVIDGNFNSELTEAILKDIEEALACHGFKRVSHCLDGDTNRSETAYQQFAVFLLPFLK